MTRKTAAIILVAVLAAGSAGLLFWLRSGTQPVRQERDVTPPRPPRRGQAHRDPATIPVMLRDSSWRTRLGAAHALRTMTALSVPQRAALLAEVLDREVEAPASGPPFTGSYLPLSSTLRLQYLSVLRSLGPTATAGVRGVAAPRTPAGREWRALAISATRDKSSAPRLRELLTSSDPAVRMTAARYLGSLQDRGAIPALRRALSDPYTTIAVSDTPDPGDTPGMTQRGFYPVRQQAARALQVLGVKVERRGDAYVVN